MRKSIRAAGTGVGLALVVLLVPSVALAVPHSRTGRLPSRHVCSAPSSGGASCNALQLTTTNGATYDAKPTATSGVAGYHPLDLQSAYNLPSSSAGGSQTVAIVDAYNDPNASSDLATYRNNFGIPPASTCSVSSSGKVQNSGGPCFLKVSQSGSPTSLPRNNGGWAQEESLDIDMVSAICPKCNIVLVEAPSASMASLGTGVNEAVKLGATAISNSYGGSESSNDSSYDTSYLKHAGVAITASSGDSGYGAEYPAASQYVTAAGGTSLSPNSSTSRGWSETAWSGAGSGCSGFDPRPAWQSVISSLSSACSRRAVADVSAVADPNTGVSVYDSYAYQGYSGWMVFGGTSVASPILASVYALAGNSGTVTYGSYPYSHTSALNDVTSGSNGNCRSPVLCRSTAGWDGPTGLGTPYGTGAF